MYLILLSIFVPILAGCLLLALPEKKISRAQLLLVVGAAYLLTAALVVGALIGACHCSISLRLCLSAFTLMRLACCSRH